MTGAGVGSPSLAGPGGWEGGRGRDDARAVGVQQLVHPLRPQVPRVAGPLRALQAAAAH